jgi:hypothetical protein
MRSTDFEGNPSPDVQKLHFCEPPTRNLPDKKKRKIIPKITAQEREFTYAKDSVHGLNRGQSSRGCLSGRKRAFTTRRFACQA